MIIWEKAINTASFSRRSRNLSKVTRLALCLALSCLLMGASAMAQTAGLSAGSASGTPGASVTIPIAFTPSSTAVSTLQFDLLYSSSLSYVADPDGNPSTDNLTGQAALAAGKSASAAPITGGVRILIFGLNLNAIGSGVVANVTLRISTSAPAGSMPLTLAGIAGSDPTGTINVPIVSSNGSVTVVALADVTPPTISGVAATNITSTGATITWTTNEASTTQVEYGTTTGYGSSTTLNSALVTSHSQALTGLTGGTLYHYRVKSKDAAGNLATSADYTFTTLDGTPPTINGVAATNITSTGATITWTTNEASTTQVEYGTTTGYGSSTTLDSSLVTSHSQALTGLTGGTLYHYRVKSRDAASNLATSADYTFTTLDGTPPTISGIAATNITSTGATITWTTNEASTTQVEYGTTTGYGSSTTLDSSLVTSHSQALTGLTGGTLYHYRVKSKDAAGNLAVSEDHTFTTSAEEDKTPPVISSVVAVNITKTSATIHWTTNEASDSQVLYGVTAAYGSSTPLDATLVTAHSQTLSNLTPGTLYHYKVRSKDVAGNPAESGDFTFVTAEEDKTPPVISSVKAVDVTKNSVTISWTTDEASTTQVYYGTTTGYRSSTTLNPALVTSHSQALTGLQPDTLYHYQVQSRDAAGNLAVSADYTFTTEADSSAPVISEITVTDVTARSAKISWTTDKPSDSQVEYWTESAAARTAGSGNPVTKHVLLLNALQKGTTYRFCVRSADAHGNKAVSPELTFTTSEYGAPAIVLPRFALNRGARVPVTETIMGMALANLESEDASVTFTAIDSEGNLVQGPDIVNPSVVHLAPGRQLPTHDSEIFGKGLLGWNSDLWIRLDSDNPDVNGLFMLLDGDLHLLDGANFAQGPVTDFVFTEIQPDGRNRIGIMNANSEDATVTIELMKADGSVRSSQTRVIRANGALTGDLFSNLFPESRPSAAEYVRVRADRGVYAFQMMQRQQGDIATLPAHDMTVGATRVFSPQYVVGGAYRTTISVVNLDPRDGMVLLRLFGEDGNQIGPSRNLAIPPYGKLYIGEGMLPSPAPDAMVTGYVEVVSDGVRLAGSTVFGDRKGQSFISALALVSELQSSVVFSHVASSDLYFTGLAIFNPGDEDVSAKLELYAADGTLVERRWEEIPAGRRRARLVSEFFSSLANSSQTSGYIRLTSSRPTASFALFGKWDLSVLSAIPAQAVESSTTASRPPRDGRARMPRRIREE